MTTPDEIELKTFPVTMRGYDQDQVSEFLTRLAEEFRTILAALDDTRREPELSELPAHQLSGDEPAMNDLTAHLVPDVGDETRQLRSDAEEDAWRLRFEARTEASRMHTEARLEARRIRAAAEAEQEEASALRQRAATALEEADRFLEGVKLARPTGSPAGSNRTVAFPEGRARAVTPATPVTPSIANEPPINNYPELGLFEILRALAELDDDQLRLLRNYEEARRGRVAIIRRIDTLLDGRRTTDDATGARPAEAPSEVETLEPATGERPTARDERQKKPGLRVTMSEALYQALCKAVQPGETIVPLTGTRPKRVAAITPTDVFLETEKSLRDAEGLQRVPGWMLQRAWDHLCAHGSLTEEYARASWGLKISCPNAVCTLLSHVADVTVVSTRTVRLRYKGVEG